MAVQTKGITWLSSMPEAKELAAREGKVILIDFSAAPD
jgi:hypothetical protein